MPPPSPSLRLRLSGPARFGTSARRSRSPRRRCCAAAAQAGRPPAGGALGGTRFALAPPPDAMRPTRPLEDRLVEVGGEGSPKVRGHARSVPLAHRVATGRCRPSSRQSLRAEFSPWPRPRSRGRPCCPRRQGRGPAPPSLRHVVAVRRAGAQSRHRPRHGRRRGVGRRSAPAGRRPHRPRPPPRTTRDELRSIAFGWLARPEELVALLQGRRGKGAEHARHGRKAVLHVHLHEAALSGTDHRRRGGEFGAIHSRLTAAGDAMPRPRHVARTCGRASRPTTVRRGFRRSGGDRFPCWQGASVPPPTGDPVRAAERGQTHRDRVRLAFRREGRSTGWTRTGLLPGSRRWPRTPKASWRRPWEASSPRPCARALISEALPASTSTSPTSGSAGRRLEISCRYGDRPRASTR